MIKSRTATIKDLKQLGQLFDGYRQFYKQDMDIQACESFLEERINNKESHIIVAERDDVLMGFTQLYPIFSSVRMQRAYLLNDLFVDKNHRKLGVASVLLDAAVDYGKQQKAAYVVLETEISNTSAQALYENQNWQKDGDHYHYGIEIKQ